MTTPNVLSDFWLYWLSTIAHDEPHLAVINGYARMILKELGVADDLSTREAKILRWAQVLLDSSARFGNFWHGLTLSSYSRDDSLPGVVRAASLIFRAPIDIEISPQCADVKVHCKSMPFILYMFLRSQQRAPRSSLEEFHHNFIEVSCTSLGYRIVVAPSRNERGLDWSDITPTLDAGEWWLSAAALELYHSGHSLTARSSGSLAAFSIDYPRVGYGGGSPADVVPSA